MKAAADSALTRLPISRLAVDMKLKFHICIHIYTHLFMRH